MQRPEFPRPVCSMSQSVIVNSPTHATKASLNFNSHLLQFSDYSSYYHEAHQQNQASASIYKPMASLNKQNSPLSQRAVKENYTGQNPTESYSDVTKNITLNNSGDKYILRDTMETDEQGDKQADLGNCIYNIQPCSAESTRNQLGDGEMAGNQAQQSHGYVYEKKMSQNFSFQWSPKKSKTEEQGSIKRFIVVQPKVTLQNNLNSYKKPDFPSPLRVKKSIIGMPPTDIYFNVNAVTVNVDKNTILTSQSTGFNKLLKKELSSGRLCSGTNGLDYDSTGPNQDTNYFGATRRKRVSMICLETRPVRVFSQPVRSDFKTIRRLGQGKYGDVSLVLHTKTGMICALKLISKKGILKQQGGMSQFVRQVSILLYLKNPHIVQLWGIFSDTQNMYLILEPAIDGQLHKYMKQMFKMEQAQVAALIKQLCIGVDYLQRQSIIHRDLKPENIIMHQGILKICDFGWAVYNQDSFRQTFCGTPLYLSPDMLTGSQYTDKVDIWAIGIITYEMLVGKIPFKITRESELAKIVTQEIRFPASAEVSETGKQFTMAMLDKDPVRRIDIEAILAHKFLKLAD